MHLLRLELTSFRNYSSVHVDFSFGANSIEGANGSGKSNLLEAIFLLSVGKSFRTHRLSELVQYKKEKFLLKGFFHREGMDHSFTFEGSPAGKRVWHDDISYSSFLPLLGTIPSIILSPEDIHILTGGPAERRRFIDLHLAASDPTYLHHLGRYTRALKQRNALLKTKGPGLSIWEELMSHCASYLIAQRCDFIAKLEKKCIPLLLHLSSQCEHLQIRYVHTLPLSPQEYIHKWQQMRGKEEIFGTTLVGPHRDDISFSLQGKEIKLYSSEGQKRCTLAAIRLAQRELLQENLGFFPLLGIDDFGVHLDHKRSSLLWELIEGKGQTFITAPKLHKATHQISFEDDQILVQKLS